MGISFLKAAILTLSGVVERPMARIRAALQAKKITVAAAGLLWGCPRMNFKAKLPFYETGDPLAGTERSEASAKK